MMFFSRTSMKHAMRQVHACAMRARLAPVQSAQHADGRNELRQHQMSHHHKDLLEDMRVLRRPVSSACSFSSNQCGSSSHGWPSGGRRRSRRTDCKSCHSLFVPSDFPEHHRPITQTSCAKHALLALQHLQRWETGGKIPEELYSTMEPWWHLRRTS